MKGRLSFLAGFAVLVSAIWGAVVMPAADVRAYATFWTGAVAVISTGFVVGYLALSRPSRDVDGKRRWSGEWFWVPSLPTIIMLVYLNSLVFRLIIPAPTSPTPEQVLSQRSASIISAAVFFVLLWLTVLWARRQVETRRAK